VRLPDEDVEFLDQYAQTQGFESRCAASTRPCARSAPQLGADYASAWAEWSGSGEAAGWNAVAADGLAG
jgi:hypothetical protein